MTFIAGAYTVEVDQSGGSSDVSVGQIESGITLEWVTNKQLVSGDNQGDTPQDAVFQGKELFVSFTLMETELLRARLLYWPYATSSSGATLEGVYGTQGVIGRLDVGSTITQKITFTSTAGTTAAAAPATLIIPRAILAEDVPVRIKFGPVLRDVTLRLRAYPDASGVFFTTT